MDALFISYRREDSAPYAGRIYDTLRQSFPKLRVFMDIDGIDPGEDFVAAIDRTLTESKIVLAVIGPKWLEVTDHNGSRRLDNPDDYVVSELHAALAGDVWVLPVLVGGAQMPPETALPAPLKPLARRNAIEISDARFRADMSRLSEIISKDIGLAAQIRREKRAGALVTTNFKRLVWAMLAMQSLSMLIGAFHEPTGLGPGLLVAAVVVGLNAWPSLKLFGGKVWARILFLLIQPMVIAGLFVGGPWAMAPAVLYTILLVGVVGTMFIDLVRDRVPVARVINLWHRLKDGQQETKGKAAS